MELKSFLFPNSGLASKYSALTYYFLLFYIISIYLKSAPYVSNITMGIILLCSILSYEKSKLNTHLLIYLGFCIFFIYQILTLSYSANIDEGLSVLQLRLPLFVFSLAFFFTKLSKQAINKIILFYGITTVFVSLIGFGFGAYLMNKTADSGYLYNDNISSFLFGKQAVYFGFYVNVAVFSLIHILRNSLGISSQSKLFIILGIVWLFFINFMLASKMAMISLYLLTLLQVLHYIIQQKRITELFILIFSGFILTFLILKMSPKTINRFTGILNTEYKYDNPESENHFNAQFDENKWNSTNTRIAIWNCGKELWKNNLLLGVGIGDKKDELLKKFKENNFIYAFKTEKNTHNQFLDIAISYGIIGIFLFLFLYFIYPLYYVFKTKTYFSISVFICLAFCFITENMLDRLQGEVIIALVIPLAIKTAYLNETEIID